jgi:hypothetical protein
MFEIFSLKQADKWQKFLEALPSEMQDIFYSPHYYQLNEKNNSGKTQCYVYSKNDKIAIYPFLINSINSLGYDLDKICFDIQGAYGYNGIISNTTDKDFQIDFFKEFENYCIENNVIAEFTRFNPVLENHLFSKGYEIIKSQENVIVDLRSSDIEHELYEYSSRKNIKKALRSGLKIIKITDDKYAWIKTFIDIYYQTMERNKAEKYYYFNAEYFVNLLKQSSSNLYFTLLDDQPISTEIVLAGKINAYSFLGGTLEKYYPLRPNDLLKDFIIRDLKNSGYHFFCLGGGSEGVIRYKKSFSKNGSRTFYIGKKIYDKEVYHNIHSQWKEKFPNEYNRNGNKVLGYRDI